MKVRKIFGVLIFAVSLLFLQKIIFAKKTNNIQKQSKINSESIRYNIFNSK